MKLRTRHSPICPESIGRQRSLQKGNSASLLFTGFLQIGHFSFTVRLRAIDR